MKRLITLALCLAAFPVFAQNTPKMVVKILPQPTIPAKPTVIVQLNPTQLIAGQPMTVTAVVEGISGYPAPSGQFQFLMNGQPVQTSALMNGGVTCEGTAPPAGTYTLTWKYLGDKYYQAIQSQ